MNKPLQVSEEDVIAETRRWVERVVVGHNFCPFAHKPLQDDTIRYSVVMAQTPEAVVEQLTAELLRLRDAERAALETTLLITPNSFNDFAEYNQFLNVVDAAIDELKLSGVIQVASFHPDYQFAESALDDVRNYTNRSPYPMFHLILEESVEQARNNHPDIEGIPEANMKRLEEMGLEQAKRQLRECRRAAFD